MAARFTDENYTVLNCVIYCGAVARRVECPSEVPVWGNSIDMGSNHAAAKGARKSWY